MERSLPLQNVITWHFFILTSKSPIWQQTNLSILSCSLEQSISPLTVIRNLISSANSQKEVTKYFANVVEKNNEHKSGGKCLPWGGPERALNIRDLKFLNLTNCFLERKNLKTWERKSSNHSNRVPTGTVSLQFAYNSRILNQSNVFS